MATLLKADGTRLKVKPLTFGSLFSGIGGIDLGFERAGMVCKWQVEIDDYCRRVLTKHWPTVPKYGDVRDVGAHNLEWVDVLAGGVPCQDISLAGKRAGLSGERSRLWFQFSRVIRELRPRYVLVENTPGLLAPIRRDGRIIEGAPIGRILGELAASRYDAEWQMLPAWAFGAPHIRERVFIVAYSTGRRWEVECSQHPRECGEAQNKGGTQADRLAGCGKAVSDANGKSERIYEQEEPGTVFGRTHPEAGSWWAVEPDIRRVAHGVPRRVDRIRGLGNAVVPDKAEWIGNLIIAFDAQRYLETMR